MEKSVFNFKIQYKDGSVLDLHEDKNLWVSSFRILSPNPEHTTDKIEGRHGSIYLGTTISERKIKATISIEAVDYIDFDLFRDELFRIFNPLEKFYIIRDLQQGKRMEVSVAGEFDVDYITLEDGEFDIEFTIHSVFLESVGTTLQLETFDSTWQIGQGLTSEDVKYIHNTPTFRIYNASDLTIDPRFFPMVIEYTGSSYNLQIENLTTGDIWTYSDQSYLGDTIRIDGIRSTRNNLSIVGKTNKKIITLAKGFNDFNIVGMTNGSIKFDFRFYYF